MKKNRHPYWKKFTNLNEAYNGLVLHFYNNLTLFTEKSFKVFIKGEIFKYFREAGTYEIKNYNTKKHQEAVKQRVFEFDRFFLHSETKQIQYLCLDRHNYPDISIPNKDLAELLQISEFTAQYQQLVKLVGKGPEKYHGDYEVENYIERRFWRNIKDLFLNKDTEQEGVDDPYWDDLDNDEYNDESDW